MELTEGAVYLVDYYVHFSKLSWLMDGEGDRVLLVTNVNLFVVDLRLTADREI